MSDNPSTQTIETELVEMIKRHDKELKELRSRRKVFVVPILTADPASPTNGQIWYRSDTHELKTYRNGTVRTITTS